MKKLFKLFVFFFVSSNNNFCIVVPKMSADFSPLYGYRAPIDKAKDPVPIALVVRAACLICLVWGKNSLASVVAYPMGIGFLMNSPEIRTLVERLRDKIPEDQWFTIHFVGDQNVSYSLRTWKGED
ncbi:MAG: hypothetical protein ABIH88_03415 [Patescibacteria group bacterium]